MASRTYLYLDNASTTKCSERAAGVLARYTEEIYGNPSSTHAQGEKAARALRDARLFFAACFRVEPRQVIFTGSGSESDNLAVRGTVLPLLRKRPEQPPEVLISAVEHPAVREAALSLEDWGAKVATLPVSAGNGISGESLTAAITPQTVLVSVMRVNNITGMQLDVEALARKAKDVRPDLVFHTDAVQAFGKVDLPESPSAVDLVSVSAHKLHGPKGVGALIVLNRDLLHPGRLEPTVFGGAQEFGLRSGTQNAGLIAAFHAAAEDALKERGERGATTGRLRAALHEELLARGLLSAEGDGPVRWNSPDTAVSHIVSLSLPGAPAGPVAKMLEERGCLVSTGSACSSMLEDPDPVLTALGASREVAASAIRVSFSAFNTVDEVRTFAEALDDSLQRAALLLGGGRKRHGRR